ncbi:MAG: LptA/OstA family protein [Alphaproteobacteria bacterium]|nr:LptA/OstA family protein [Alphaproteobacteria bacterium]
MKTYLRLVSFACLSLLVLAGPAVAKNKMTANNSEPDPPPSEMIDISADQSLEWYQDTKLYVARGKAKAIRGDMIVEADLLTAHQRDTKTPPKEDKASPSQKTQGAGNIDQMTAEGHVYIHDLKQQAFGDKAVYDMDQRAFKMTGANLKYMTEKDIVTARDSLEYYEDRQVALAKGRAIGEHQGNRVEADVLSAQFGRTAAGQMEMTQMFGKGNVLITTKDGGLSRGDNAVYDVKKNIAILTKNVRITRGETQLSGDKAEVNFTTNQSRLINSGTGRVRALLPSSNKKNKKGGP